MSAQIEELKDVAEAIESVTRPTAPVPMAPESDEVELPVGLVNPGSVVRIAKVRELNGYDEEAIARAKGMGPAMLTILERATVRIGDSEATPELLRELFIADRLALLVGISRVTWGKIVVVPFTCPACDHSEDMDYDLDNLRIVNLDPADAWFSVALRNGRTAQVHLPQGDVHEILLREQHTAAEYRTLLLDKCVEEIDGTPVFGDSVKRLSSADRKVLADAIQEVPAGPQLTETTLDCPACGKEVSAVLTVGDLFPF